MITVHADGKRVEGLLLRIRDERRDLPTFAAIARELDVWPETVSRWRHKGCGRASWLALQALLAGLHRRP